MRVFLLVFAGVILGAVGLYFVERYFTFRTIAQNIEEYVPSPLGKQVAHNEYSEDFLLQKIEEFKRSGEKFVLADLSEMRLDVYEGGLATLSFPIQAKGREGSWWETPAGLYSVKSKAENHLSSIGNVYMPWSMQFQGNFFIHGLPYYPDGTPVSTSYSGGCIRLATEDAEKVFRYVKNGTPLIVFENTKSESPVRNYTFGPSILSAGTFLVADLKTGFTFGSQKTKEPISPSFAAQLLLAVISAEYMDIERNIMVDPSDLVETRIPRLKPATKHMVYDYLYLVLQEGSYEASNVLARALGTMRTIDLLGQKAKAIGMKDTTFNMSETKTLSLVTNAEDIYQLLRYMYFNRKFLLTISANTAETHIYGTPSFKNLENNNLFVGDPSFVGGSVTKNGTKASGAFIFEIPFGDTKEPIAIIVTDSENIVNDVTAIRAFVQTSFKK